MSFGNQIVLVGVISLFAGQSGCTSICRILVANFDNGVWVTFLFVNITPVGEAGRDFGCGLVLYEYCFTYFMRSKYARSVDLTSKCCQSQDRNKQYFPPATITGGT